MNDTDFISWLALRAVKNVGPVAFAKLTEAFGSPEKVFKAPLDQLLSCVRAGVAQDILAFQGWEQAEKEFLTLKSHGIQILTYRDPLYPKRLKQADSFPVLLFVQGDLSRIPSTDGLGVVGSRDVSPYGTRVTKKLVTDLVAHNIVIISGFARGVDMVAHLTAVEQGGYTVAVLGGGLGEIYPAAHRRYVDEVLKRGVLISEFPFYEKPRPEYFPRRNRIISGLSRGVLVVEAAEKSGALITAQYALDQNRDLFAVPGPIDSPFSKGCNRLIQAGAQLVSHAEDILNEWNYGIRSLSSSSALTDPEEEAVYQHCLIESVGTDDLIEKTGLTADKISMILTKLELAGKLKALPGRRFQSL